MEHVRWTGDLPELSDPILVLAFEGWNDAGDSASTALRWLRERWASEPLAEIDGEEFYDFTSTRPHVRLIDGVERVIDWPAIELTWGREAGRDVIAMLGVEPQLHWKTFINEVLSIAHTLGVDFAVSLGALLTDVPHTKPINVIGTATDPEVLQRLGLQRSGYEGPTGVIGVLHDAFSRAGIDSASLWAPVPSYVPGAPSPKAALALVLRTSSLLNVGLVTTDLEIASAAYERQISEVVADDTDMTEYVERLERHYDSARDIPSGDELVEEVERFLREQG